MTHMTSGEDPQPQPDDGFFDAMTQARLEENTYREALTRRGTLIARALTQGARGAGWLPPDLNFVFDDSTPQRPPLQNGKTTERLR